MWIKYNNTTKLYEVSPDQGANWSNLILDAAQIGQGVLGIDRIPSIPYSKLNLADSDILWSKLNKAGSSLSDLATRAIANLSDGANVAKLDAANVFTQGQTIVPITYNINQAGGLTFRDPGSNWVWNLFARSDDVGNARFTMGRGSTEALILESGGNTVIGGDATSKTGRFIQKRDMVDIPERRNWMMSTEVTQAGDWQLLRSSTNTGTPDTSVLQATRHNVLYFNGAHVNASGWSFLKLAYTGLANNSNLAVVTLGNAYNQVCFRLMVQMNGGWLVSVCYDVMLDGYGASNIATKIAGPAGYLNPNFVNNGSGIYSFYLQNICGVAVNLNMTIMAMGGSSAGLASNIFTYPGS